MELQSAFGGRRQTLAQLVWPTECHFPATKQSPLVPSYEPNPETCCNLRWVLHLQSLGNRPCAPSIAPSWPHTSTCLRGPTPPSCECALGESIRGHSCMAVCMNRQLPGCIYLLYTLTSGRLCRACAPTGRFCTRWSSWRRRGEHSHPRQRRTSEGVLQARADCFNHVAARCYCVRK